MPERGCDHDCGIASSSIVTQYVCSVADVEVRGERLQDVCQLLVEAQHAIVIGRQTVSLGLAAEIPKAAENIGTGPDVGDHLGMQRAELAVLWGRIWIRSWEARRVRVWGNAVATVHRGVDPVFAADEGPVEATKVAGTSVAALEGLSAPQWLPVGSKTAAVIVDASWRGPDAGRVHVLPACLIVLDGAKTIEAQTACDAQ